MNRLGTWLAEQGMTQESFAKVIGAHQTQVSRYVTGERRPSRRVQKDIEEATQGAVPATASSWPKARPPARTARRVRRAVHQTA